MLLAELFGTVGLILLLVTFILNIAKKIKRNSKIYNSLNFLGAGLLVYYSYTINSRIFFILELIWALVALYFLIKLIIKK